MAKKKRRNKKVERSRKTVKNIGLIIGTVVSICIANVLFTMATGEHFRSGENVLAYKSGSGSQTQSIIANRGYIYDRNKEIIAQDIESYDLYAVISSSRISEGDEPTFVNDFEDASDKLAGILECDASIILKFFKDADANGSYQTEFGTYGKGLSAEKKLQIESLGIAGLEFNKSTDRVYPTGSFASQLIGYAQYNYDDNKISGVMGIEKYYDEELSGRNGSVTYQTDSTGNYLPATKKYTKTAVDGDDVYLTIDKNVQVTLEKALSDTMKNNSANKAWGIVMEAKTGKILAQAGYPTFDLNTREGIEDNAYNLPSEWIYECGSVMKSMIYAACMNEGVYNGSAPFNSKEADVGYDNNGNLVRVDEVGYGDVVATVNDALGKDYGTISFDEGLIRSCNTGIVSLLTKYLSTDKEYDYLEKFGFGKKIGIKGMSEAIGQLADNTPLDRIMTGFGQSSTVNAYQLVQAYSAIFGDGSMVKPYIVDKVVDPSDGAILYKGKTVKSEKIISDETVNQMKALLTRVVTESYGTAHHYAMSDITMMAKTGTAQIVVDGKYSTTDYVSSIMAAAPAEDPQIIFYYAFEGSNILTYNTSYFQDVVREALVAVSSYNESSSQTQDNSLSNQDNNSLNTYEEYSMPSLVNHTVNYVSQKLDGFKTNTIIIGDGSSIIEQYPVSGTGILSNQNLFLLTDGTNITIPNMSGWSRKDISIYASLVGMKVTYNGSGKLVSQSIAEGSVINSESKLSVELK